MPTYFKNIAWYPPAETKVPWHAIFSVFTSQSREFKYDLLRFLKVDHCVLGESARALLFKLLETLKKQNHSQRDEVLIPGYTCYSVAAAIVKAGLKINVYDLDPSTLYPDLDSLKSAVSEKTLAVVFQHLFGIFTPIYDIQKITCKFGAYLIEDAAQTLGTFGNGKAPGTIGDFGLFSFGRGKPLPVGGGGALVSDTNSEILDSISLDRPKMGYKQASLLAATQIISKPAFYWIPELLPFGLGKTVFDPGFTVEAIPNALEKILINALPSLNQLNGHRKCISDIYSKRLANKLLLGNINNSISLIRYPIMLLDSSMTKELNRIGVRNMYPSAISDVRVIKPYLKANHISTPGAVEISKRLLTLPTHIGINKKVAKQICIEIVNFVNSN